MKRHDPPRGRGPTPRVKRIDTYRDSVWCDTSLTAHEKLVLLAFAKTMDFDTLGGAHPGDPLVSLWTGLHQDTVWRIRRQLTAKGWLTLTHQGGSPKGGRRQASTYRGNIPDPPRGAGGEASRPPAWARPDPPRGAGPPSQGPADDAATAGAASSSAQRTTRSGGPSANGSTPCEVDGCDGKWHTLTDPLEPCPRREAA